MQALGTIWLQTRWKISRQKDGEKISEAFWSRPKDWGLLNPDAMKNFPLERRGKNQRSFLKQTEGLGSVESRRDENSPVSDGEKISEAFWSRPKDWGLLNPNAMKNFPSLTGKKSREALFKQTEALGSVESRRDEKSPITKKGKKISEAFWNRPKDWGLLNPDAMKNLPSQKREKKQGSFI